ncbi:hypothetical protein [Tritonibacter mobilis]|uniref:hypothetical protein n=1 Tax=Tritonibacter mobilis TaxID=379347 RepID=UPI0008069F0A|nr:hypothetical protein [Tritonibacter mobilis]
MGIEDGLDVFGAPVIALPSDLGDGPFASALPDPNAPRPAISPVDERFRRTEPFEDNILTDNPLLGPSRRIAVGRIYVSDTIPAESFRRVVQHFSLRSVASLGGFPVIVFQGSPLAVIEEGLGMIAPKPDTPQVSGGRAPAPSPPPDGPPSALERAFETLDGLNEIVRPTMSIQTSSYNIRFRRPGFEPHNALGTVAPASIMTFDPTQPSNEGMQAANTIDEFFFSNSGGTRREFEFNYAVGDNIPLIFDIVNHNPIYAVQAAFSVTVLVDRSGGNTQN